jgi:hypothetical protein
LDSKRIAAENADFGKAPRHAQRMVIARDVLRQLAAQKLRAVTGYFVGNVWGVTGCDDYEVPDGMLLDNIQVKDVLDSLPTCDVCAVGALFTCTVQRKNALMMGDFKPNFFSISGYLSKWFSLPQLGLIEIAFEIGRGAVLTDGAVSLNYVGLTDAEYDRAADFAPGSTPEERLEKIMKNIIKNRGEFVP